MDQLTKFKSSENPRQIPKGYDASTYPKASIAVDIVAFSIGEKPNKNPRKLSEKHLQVLLIRRKEVPFQNWWALPGGFLKVAPRDKQCQPTEPEETLYRAAARELQEETGLENAHLELLGTWSEPDRDPRDRVISVAFLALVQADKQTLRAETDAVEAEWFKVNYEEISLINEMASQRKRVMRLSLTKEHQEYAAGNYCVDSSIYDQVPKISAHGDPTGIAFDHGEIIVRGLEQLRSVVDDTAILFQLAPPVFTLTELQHMYEAVLQRELIAPNFRRAVQGFVDKVPENERPSTEPSQHRTPEYYRFNPEQFKRIRMS